MALRQEALARRLRELRERDDLSQEKAAQKVDITHRQWQRWENGESMPRAGKLGEIALAFGVGLDWFDDQSDTPTQLDRIEDALKQLVERQEAVERAVTGLARRLDDDDRRDDRGQRRAS